MKYPPSLLGIFKILILLKVPTSVRDLDSFSSDPPLSSKTCALKIERLFQIDSVVTRISYVMDVAKSLFPRLLSGIRHSCRHHFLNPAGFAVFATIKLRRRRHFTRVGGLLSRNQYINALRCGADIIFLLNDIARGFWDIRKSDA